MKYLQAKLTTICSFKLVTIPTIGTQIKTEPESCLGIALVLALANRTKAPRRLASYQISPFILVFVICPYMCCLVSCPCVIIKLSLSLVSIEIKLRVYYNKIEKTKIIRPEVVELWREGIRIWIGQVFNVPILQYLHKH